MGATSTCVGVGHTLKDATANQHPPYEKLTHKGGCAISCAKVQNPARLGQSSVGHSGTERNSMGPQDVSETAPSGQCKDR